MPGLDDDDVALGPTLQEKERKETRTRTWSFALPSPLKIVGVRVQPGWAARLSCLAGAICPARF
jgi:hypothetical protein